MFLSKRLWGSIHSQDECILYTTYNGKKGNRMPHTCSNCHVTIDNHEHLFCPLPHWLAYCIVSLLANISSMLFLNLFWADLSIIRQKYICLYSNWDYTFKWIDSADMCMYIVPLLQLLWYNSFIYIYPARNVILVSPFLGLIAFSKVLVRIHFLQGYNVICGLNIIVTVDKTNEDILQLIH